LVKGWHAAHQVCDAGAISLLVQGDPPHPKFGLCHWSLVAVDRSLWGQADRQPIRESGRKPGDIDRTFPHRWTGGSLCDHRHLHTPCRFCPLSAAENGVDAASLWAAAPAACPRRWSVGAFGAGGRISSWPQRPS